MGVAGLSKCIAIDMQKFGVTSNAIAPFAWTRMVATIPATPENKKRLEVNRRLKPERIAPLVVRWRARRGARRPGKSSAYETTRSTCSASHADSHGAHGGWMDTGDDRGTRPRRLRAELFAARTVERSVHLGPGLTGLRRHEPAGAHGAPFPPQRIATAQGHDPLRAERRRGSDPPTRTSCDWCTSSGLEALPTMAAVLAHPGAWIADPASRSISPSCCMASRT